MKRVVLICFLAVSGCAPTAEDFSAAGQPPDRKAQDFAACKITARQTAAAAGPGSIVYSLQYNETLEDCMTAKGYGTNSKPESAAEPRSQ